MKATGIVRRIDDLGRVVIPKEIRRTMRIREGDPLEIFTDRDGEVILKKYSPIGELGQFAEEYAESASKILNCIALVSDADQIIAVAGASKKMFMEKKISKDLETIINNKTTYLSKSGDKNHSITAEDTGTNDYISQLMVPIISQGDPIGAIIFLSPADKGTAFGQGE
ncbi:MAG: stage V sporulation T C-terminal domain-containing protein, partial [Anaerovorax sp.]